MIQHQVFTFNPFQENTWLIWNEAKDCIILDPGCCNKKEEKELTDFLEERELKPKGIWLTHCHIDHVLGLSFCTEKWDIPYHLHQLEAAPLKSVEVYAPVYGFNGFKAPSDASSFLSAGNIRLGEEVFDILEVPGHSPGHLAFYHAQTGQVWSGDVLFRESIGRTDLPGGSFEQLCTSIREVLYRLPERTRVFSGHGPETSIGHEMRCNPFVPR